MQQNESEKSPEEKRKGALTLSLDERNSIVIRLPNGDTLDFQLSSRSRNKGKIGVTIHADKSLQIWRASRRETNE